MHFFGWISEGKITFSGLCCLIIGGVGSLSGPLDSLESLYNCTTVINERETAFLACSKRLGGYHNFCFFFMSPDN